MSASCLKIIAIVSMLCDHIAVVFFPDAIWLRILGRFAMPIFAFFIAEGYIHTHSKKQYLLRHFIFALISEVPFDLATQGKIGIEYQNILFTFCFSIITLLLFDKISGEPDENGRKSSFRFVAAIIVAIDMAILAILLRLDYGALAVISVLIFYLLKDQKNWIRQICGIGFLSASGITSYMAFTGLGIIPLLFYNGQKGKDLKWLFYAFYPGHLLILYLIKLIA